MDGPIVIADEVIELFRKGSLASVMATINAIQ